jgi:DNA helicase-2/ATP-dependent DNA helicase PcrA
MPTHQQQLVIDAHQGTIIVQACPGSGKTSTLVNRCKALPVNETKLVLAFNKKAAEEFASRMGTVPGADVRTFHSFCFREVMGNPGLFGYDGKPSLSDDGLFRLMCRANSLDAKGWDESPWDEDFINYCEHAVYDHELRDQVANSMPIHDITIPCEGGCSDQFHMVDSQETISAKALLKTRAYLIHTNRVTFDSMVRLVAEHRHSIKRAGTHIMIDEYQDVDRFQFDIGCALAEKASGSFAVVGDPNQRIYGWRGALSDAFSAMSAAYPQAQILPLTQNFRSVEPILQFAEKICAVGMTGVRGEGDDPVRIVDPKESNVLDELMKGAGPNFSQVAILCRSNRECARWQLELAQKGIPVYLIGKGQFWNEKHIKIAKEHWSMRQTEADMFASEAWAKLVSTKRYREDEDALKEIEDDARWIVNLDPKSMNTLQNTLQREVDGLRISTIHKTKGMEFDRVMISGCGEKLMQDTFVYYVAVTRPKNLLILA